MPCYLTPDIHNHTPLDGLEHSWIIFWQPLPTGCTHPTSVCISHHNLHTHLNIHLHQSWLKKVILKLNMALNRCHSCWIQKILLLLLLPNKFYISVMKPSWFGLCKVTWLVSVFQRRAEYLWLHSWHRSFFIPKNNRLFEPDMIIIAIPHTNDLKPQGSSC